MQMIEVILDVLDNLSNDIVPKQCIEDIINESKKYISTSKNILIKGASINTNINNFNNFISILNEKNEIDYRELIGHIFNVTQGSVSSKIPNRNTPFDNVIHKILDILLNSNPSVKFRIKKVFNPLKTSETDTRFTTKIRNSSKMTENALSIF